MVRVRVRVGVGVRVGVRVRAGAEVARVGLAELQAAERRVEQRRYFGGEATTVQARIRRLVRGRVRGVGLGLGARVRVGLGLGRGCRGRSRGYPRGEASIGRLRELQ